MKKLSLLLAIVLFGFTNLMAQPPATTADIYIHSTTCADFSVTLKPSVDFTNTYLTNIQFTVKWPVSSPNTSLTDASSTLTIVQQGSMTQSGGYNYATFVGVNDQVNWSGGTEYEILTFSHDQAGTGTGDFVIMAAGDSHASISTVFYVELFGSDITGNIHNDANGVDLGKPAITLGSNPVVCQGVTSADLNYSGTTYSPDQYSIDFDATAEGQGFNDVAYTSLPSSPITLTVPAGAVPGTYNGTLTVKKSADGCESVGFPITVTVNALPVALVLSGNTICETPGGNGTITSTTSVTGVGYQLYDGSDNTVQSLQPGTGSGLIWSNLSAGTGYYVIGTDGNSCTSTSNNVDVSTYPNPTCSISGDDGPVCPGSSNVYTASAGMSNYAWSITGNGSISGSSSNQTVTVIASSNCNQSFTLSVEITDGNGCSSDCDKVVNVNDTEKPLITTTATNQDLGCNPTVVAPTFTGTDNCEGTITPVVTTSGPSNTGCAYTQTWDANYTDGCNNVADQVSITYTWTVDAEKPVLATTATSGDLGCNPTVVAPTFTGTDNCEGTITPVVTASGPSNTGCAYTQTWDANYTDGCNNVADQVSITYTWTVDTEKPVLATTATNSDLGCNPTVVAPVFTGTDNCEGTITPVVTTSGPSNTGCAYTQTWDANYTDACNNIADQVSITYTWTVDTEKPVLATTATNSDLGCNPTVVAPTFTGTDNCEGSITPVVTTSGPSNTGCAYTQTWDANYTDACNNVADQVSITYTWTVDTEKPVLATTATSGDLGCNPTVVAPTFTGTDNCEGTITPVVTTSGPSNTGCAYTQTWDANYTDGCNNVADQVSITYTWTVDAEKPVLATTATSGDLGCNPTVVAPTFTGTDNCEGTITPVVTASGPSNTGCAYTQTWDANYTDGCNNVADQVSITYTWTVDTEKPVLATTATNSDLGCNPTVVAPVFTGTDNCEGTITPVVTTSGPSNTGCAYTQTWDANYTDACNNIADQVSITYTWTVDTEKPVLATTATNSDLGCNPTVVAPTFTGTDNCEGSITPVVTTSGPSNTGCAYTQTWDANYTDACNNVADQVSITYTWTVDTEKPVLATTATSGDLGCNPTVVAPTFTGTDNCEGSITPVVTTSGPSNTGCAYTQTWDANYTDGCNNVADQVSITYTWTVDTEKPVLATTATNSDLGCNPTVVAPTFTGTDNCEGSITPVVTTSGPSNTGCAYTQTWDANYTDGCNNVADQVSITYTWTVDAEKPVLATTATSGDLGCNPTVVAPVFSGTDNCEGSITPNVTTSGPSNTGCAYTQTWDANYTDGCNNVADQVSITYTWTEDTEVPVITLLGDATVNICQGTPYTDAGATASDNCEGDITASIVTTGDVIDVNTPGTYYVTYDVTDACGNNAVQVIRTVIIETTATAGTLVKTPDADDVVESYDVSAVLTAGTGGNGIDELEYSTDGGSNWLPYISGDPISTTGLTSVQIRTRRLADYCASSSFATVSWTVHSALQYVIDNTVLSSISGTIGDLTATFPAEIPPVIVAEPYKINSRMTISGDAIPAGSTVSILITVNGSGPFPYVTNAPIPSSPFWVTDLAGGSPADFDALYGGRVELYNITINSAGGNPLELNGQVLIESIISKDGFSNNTVLDDISLDFTIPADETAALAWLQAHTLLSSVSGTIADLTATFPDEIPPVIVDEPYQINSKMTLSGDPVPAGSTVSILITVNGVGPMPYVTDAPIPASPFWVTDLFDPAATPADFDAGYGGRIEIYNITIKGPCTNNSDVNGQVKIESIISKDGFSNNTILDDISLDFTILATPVLVITNPSAVCEPNTVDLTDPDVTAGSTWPTGTVLTYWTDITAITPLLGEDGVSAGGTYYIKATSTEGCFDIAPVIVTINYLPNNSTSSNGFKGNSVCLGETGMLTFDAINATFVEPYTIEYTDGTTTWSQAITDPGAYSFAVAVNPTVTTGYTLVSITNGNGCTRLSNFGDHSATITIYALPVISLSASNVNHGQTLSIDATVTGGQSPYSFDWTGPNGYTGTDEDVSIANSQPVNSGTYTLTVTDNHGCYSVESIDVIVYSTDLYVNDAINDGTELWCTGATGDDNNPGTISAPFLTIGHAISIAIPGDKIWVDAGTYTENIVVDKELIFQGAGATKTHLTAGPGIVAEVTADNVTFDGFEVTHTTVTTLADMGIRLNMSDYSTIQNNTFTMNSLGIQLLDAGSNTIFQNEFVYNAIGIYLEGTTDGNGHFDGGSNGPFYSLSLNNTVESNNIHQSVLIGGEGGQGIYLDAACESNQFLNNTITDNDAIGYYAWKASNNTLTGNTISDNGSEGIQLMGSSGNSITGNTIENNTNYGMWLRSGALSSTSSTITGNTITGNGTGILLNDDEESNGYVGVVSGNNISNNKIYSNTYGLLTLESPVGVIYNAENNWWGAASGPYRSSDNTCGTGNEVADNITICNWYTYIAMTPGDLNGCVTVASNVTGGGEYCDDGIGLPVGLDNSDVGVNYQLYFDGTTAVGMPVAGDGDDITFGNQAEGGEYTVKATNTYTGCSDVLMAGSVTIIVDQLPATPSAGNELVVYDGSVHTSTATPPSGSSVVWYDAPTGGNIADPPSGITVGVYSRWAESVDNVTGCPSPSRTQVSVIIDPVSIDLKVMLQGLYNTTSGEMNSDLNTAGEIPLAQPYNVAPWNYAGTESVASIPANVVDWVLVELRTGIEANTMIGRSAGLLYKDGNVSVSIDDIAFPDVVAGSDYNIVIWHRNHMPVMSASAQTAPVESYDFTDDVSLYGTNPAIDLGGGTYGMIAGDVTHNGMLQYSGPGNDRGAIIGKIAEIVGSGVTIISTVENGYWYEDANMNNELRYLGTADDRSGIISNLNTLNGSPYLNNTYTSVVPGAYTGSKESMNNGPVDIQIAESGQSVMVDLTTNETIENGMVDNIQFTLAWKANDNEVEALLGTLTSLFNLQPQGNPVELDGNKYLVFVSVVPSYLPSQWNSDETVTVMSFVKNNSQGFSNRLWIADNDFTVNHNGEYFVSNWGTDVTGSIVSPMVGINDLELNNTASIYPNPVHSDFVNIELNMVKDQKIIISVINIQGKEVFSKTLSVKAGISVNQFKLNNIEQGVYFIKIVGNKLDIIEKLVIR